MLQGVTAAGAEGEALSPARPSSPTPPAPPNHEVNEERASSGSSPLRPSCLPPGKVMAAVVPGPCWRPWAQLCLEQRRAGAVIQAGKREETQDGSKSCGTFSRPPPGSTQRGPGAAACGASQESEQMVGGCSPLPLAGQLKIVTGRRSSRRGWEHLLGDQPRGPSAPGGRDKLRRGATPHTLISTPQTSAALIPVPHPGPWQMPSKGAFRAVLAPLAGAGAGGRASCRRWRQSRDAGCGAGGRLARPPGSPQRHPFLRGRERAE